jgi:hypothetical protein
MRDKQPRNQVEHVMVVLFEEQIKKACTQKSQCSGEESDRTTWALPKGNDLFQREREEQAGHQKGGLVLRNPMILFEGTGAGIRVALMHGIMAIAMPSQRQFTSISGARHRKQEPKTPSPWTGEETPIFFSPRVHYKNTWLARCVRIT